MSASESSSGPLPPGFRRLQRNDTEQTPDLKPSEPSIMEERKQEIRTAMALQLQVPEEAVPPTSSTLVWERYAIEKSSYEDRLELYKIKFKEVNETYPHENRKVFQMVEKAMSDASVDDLKRTTEGAAAHASRDAFTFLRLAMEAHDFVPAQISDRACQNAQMRFESYRQPPSASISEHINEFKRRLEYYCKLRGDKIEEVYRDYQLKGLLLASLHPEAWGEWCRIRQLTSTMPITFEAVEVALLEEESARVLSCLKDPYSDVLPTAAHGTSATETLHPTFCSDCGNTFCPARPSHHRCGLCQKRFTTDKKKRRDTTKTGKSTTKAEGKASARPPPKSVNETKVYPADASDDEDHEAPWASYATTVVTSMATDAIGGDYVIFDPASNSHVIRDRALAVDVNTSGPITRVRGSVPGSLEVREHATLGDMGTSPLSFSFTRDLISESAALAAGYHVVHDTRIANEYHLLKEGRPVGISTVTEALGLAPSTN